MTTQTSPQITDQDRQLLVAVNRWARENGWETGWSGPTRQNADRTVGIDWNTDIKTVSVSRRRHRRDLWPLFGSATYEVESVRQAIDLLAALGVLPAELSSAYETGAAHAVAACSYHPVGAAA